MIRRKQKRAGVRKPSFWLVSPHTQQFGWRCCWQVAWFTRRSRSKDAVSGALATAEVAGSDPDLEDGDVSPSASCYDARQVRTLTSFVCPKRNLSTTGICLVP